MLKYNDIVDLARWRFIQFADKRTTEEAIKKHEAYLRRQTDEDG